MRKARQKSAQKQDGCLLRRVAHILTFCEVFASAGRVLRAKSAPKLIENFGISIDNREFWLQNARRKAPQISGKAWNHSGSGRNLEKSGSSESSKMKIHDVFRALPRNRTISSVAKTEKTSRHGDFKFIFASCRGVFVTFKLHFSIHFEVCLSPSNFILPHI